MTPTTTQRWMTHLPAERLCGRLSDSLNGSPDGRLWDGAVEEDAESAVEAEHAVPLHRLPHAVRDARVALARSALLVQLQLRLHVLRRKRDADFYAAGDATWWTDGEARETRANDVSAVGTSYSSRVCVAAS